ncbi:MAG: LemA family protein [Candidatus Micrarchaeia archaeon]
MAELAFAFCCGFFLVIFALLALFYVVSIYNGLINLRNNIDKAWANIDVLLKQRSDLIPNLVETVKGYKKYEKGLLEEITRLRTSMMGAQGPAEKAKANDAISASLKTIFAVAEGYPDLKASENFLELQKQLSSIENQIADRREFYNDSVLLFNTKIHSIPDMVFAGILGFKDKEYFKATEDEKKAVEVKIEEESEVPTEKDREQAAAEKTVPKKKSK